MTYYKVVLFISTTFKRNMIVFLISEAISCQEKFFQVKKYKQV
jgi:hypothetical protein